MIDVLTAARRRLDGVHGISASRKEYPRRTPGSAAFPCLGGGRIGSAIVRSLCCRRLCLVLAALAIGPQASGQELPTKELTLAKMALANDYFMAKWPDPTAPIVSPDKTRPSNIWTRATYYEGLLAMYYIDPQPLYYDYAVDWGEGHNWQPANGDTTGKDANNQCAGQAYIELYLLDPQPERITPIKATIDYLVANPSVNKWYWIDAIHMAMPVFAKLGAVYDDDDYYNKMYAMYNYAKTQEEINGLYNPVDHLWWRDKNFDPPVTAPNGEDVYWSRGNGWVFVALARVLDVMPEGTPHRSEYVTTFQQMAAALVAVQREDGFWNASLHDPDHYAGKETSGTAMFTFGLAWGVNNGLLVGDQYTRAAIKGWNGMINDALHPNGFLGYVQSTADDPSDSWPFTYDGVPNFEDYTLGAFLLAGSEIYELSNVALPGDYNGDGTVDSADYTVWRDNLGDAVLLPGDTTLGMVSPADYDVWKTHFGQTLGSGSTSGRNVPEPASAVLLLAAAACCGRCAERTISRLSGCRIQSACHCSPAQQCRSSTGAGRGRGCLGHRPSPAHESGALPQPPCRHGLRGGKRPW